MQHIQQPSIPTEFSPCDIYVGDHQERLKHYLEHRRAFWLVDSNLQSLYAHILPTRDIIVIPSGEDGKRLSQVQKVVDELAQRGCNKADILIAFGGGMVCDLCGFVASIYMRGIDCIYLCSSLMAQVDAGLGGKTALNHRDIKNLLGSVRMPKAVFCDPVFLNTLPDEFYHDAFAEVIKYAILGNPELLEILLSRHARIKNRDSEVLEEIISLCVRQKLALVAKDPLDKSERRLLNLGHSFGHLLELQLGLSHGKAVAEGIRICAYVSNQMGYLTTSDMEKVNELLLLYGFDALSNREPQPLPRHILLDKKASGDQIDYIFLRSPLSAFRDVICIQKLWDVYNAMP